MSNEYKVPKFVSENTIEQQKKAREEKGLDEAPYDPRTLYERLEEQRKIKEEAYAEATKLGNQIHRIDDDESEFLIELIENEKRKKTDIEKAENDALDIFKQKVAQKIKEPILLQQQVASSLNIKTEKNTNSKATQSKSKIEKALPKSSYEKKLGKYVQVIQKSTSSQQNDHDHDTEAIDITRIPKKAKISQKPNVSIKSTNSTAIKEKEKESMLLVDYYSDSE